MAQRPAVSAFTTEIVALAALTPHPQNYQIHPPANRAHIRASLLAHGYYKNIVVAQDNTLLAGHGVVAVATELGWTDAPVHRLPYPPDHPEALKVLIGDNDIARLNTRDDAQLATLLAGLQAQEVSLDGTGWDAAGLEALLAEQGQGLGGAAPTEVQEPDEPWSRLAEVLDRWEVQEGDVWQLGRHRLIHGSCLDDETLGRLLDGTMPRMIFADPPYGVSIVATNVPVGGGEAYDIPFGGVKHPRRRSPVGGGQRHKDLTGHYPIEMWGKDIRGAVGAAKPFGSKAGRGSDGASHIVAVGKYAPVIGDDSPLTAIESATSLLTAYPKAVHVWWGGNYYADHLPASSCWLIWDKETTGNFADCELAWTNQEKAARLFHHRWNGMLRASEHERRWHPTQKPAALAAWVYETLGAVGDVILDPFLGSGPSLLAAEQCDRTVYGCELSLEYVAITLDRWHTLTGLVPQRLEP